MDEKCDRKLEDFGKKEIIFRLFCAKSSFPIKEYKGIRYLQ